MVTNITSEAVHSVREQMAAQSANIGARHRTSMVHELRMSTEHVKKITKQTLAMKLAPYMLEYARIEHTPFLDVDITKMDGASSEETRIEVVAVHPAVWSRITRLLRDLEQELAIKERA